MINVSIDSLRDFQSCSLYYNYKYNEQLEKKITQLRKTQHLFKETLISVVNFFFFKKLSYQEPSYKTLENKWEKRWIKDNAEDAVLRVNSAQNEYPTDAFYTTKATAALLEFHRWFADKPGYEVILIDEPFIVPLNKGVALKDSFDLVLRTKKSDGTWKYHVYAWSVNLANRQTDFWSTHFTALDYAFRFRNKFDPNLDVSYYLWDFTDSKPGVRQFLIEIKDHALLKLWADRVASSEQYYPIRGLSAYCKTCVYDKECKNWSFSENAEVKERTRKVLKVVEA